MTKRGKEVASTEKIKFGELGSVITHPIIQEIL